MTVDHYASVIKLSFTATKNRITAITEPWGTPVSSRMGLERWLPMTTWKERFRYLVSDKFPSVTRYALIGQLLFDTGHSGSDVGLGQVQSNHSVDEYVTRDPFGIESTKACNLKPFFEYH